MNKCIQLSRLIIYFFGGKMKKILIGLFIIFVIIVIYLKLTDKKIYYLSIGDSISNGINTNYSYSNYISDYLDELGVLEKYVNISKDNNRVTDIINDINNNKIYGDKSVQNLLIKADIITVSVGYNDIVSKIDKYDNFDSYLNDLDKLYKLLRVYSKEKIIMIGYYNPLDNKYNDKIKYLNNLVKELCDKYNIEFIDNEDINKYLNNSYPNIEGQHIIFNKIRDKIDKIVK